MCPIHNYSCNLIALKMSIISILLFPILYDSCTLLSYILSISYILLLYPFLLSITLCLTKRLHTSQLVLLVLCTLVFLLFLLMCVSFKVISYYIKLGFQLLFLLLTFSSIILGLRSALDETY